LRSLNVRTWIVTASVNQFGGCDRTIPKCLPTVARRNYMLRFYLRRKEIPDGTWKFPEAQPVS